MAREEEVGSREMGMRISNFQSDLIRRFVTPIQFSPKIEEAAVEEEEIELSLGLSLNGRFGVDPKKLARSASVVDFSMIHHGPVKEEVAPLMRTCSLPTETEEEWRKRKELQTLRRMEAKRKRTEKQMNLRSVKRVFGGEEYCDGDKVLNGVFTDKVGGGGFEGLPPQAQSSQGSIGSLGSGSSGISDFDSQPPIQDPVGMNKCSDAASPSSVHSLTECEHKPAVATRTTITEKQGKFSGVVMKNASEKVAVAEKEGKNGMKNVLENMPCVSTKGDGPDGIRIEGFLYRYRKGEEVKIMCVCHGSFLSPAEFVKHAGGGDVEHPLKHIVVSSSFL